MCINHTVYPYTCRITQTHRPDPLRRHRETRDDDDDDDDDGDDGDCGDDGGVRTMGVVSHREQQRCERERVFATRDDDDDDGVGVGPSEDDDAGAKRIRGRRDRAVDASTRCGDARRREAGRRRARGGGFVGFVGFGGFGVHARSVLRERPARGGVRGARVLVGV